MKVKINDACEGCGICEDICPDVFAMDGDLCVVKQEEVPAGCEDQAREAAEACPAEAIEVQD